MSDGENKPLLGVKEERNGLGFRYILLLAIMLCIYTPMGINFYLTTQWIQYTMRQEILLGASINSSSVCEGKNQSDPEYMKFKEVEQKTAFWQMLSSLAMSIPGLFSTLILPSYSDNIGRKFLFLIPTSAMLLKYVAYALIFYFKWNVLWLVVSSLVEGFSGSFFTLTSGTYSYIADITTPGRQRTVGVTIHDGILLISITLSGLAAGYFIEYEGYFIPMISCACIQFFAWISIILFLPETHEKRYRTTKMSVCAHLRRVTEFYRSKQFSGKRCAYILLLIAYFVGEATSVHRSSLEMLYQLGKPFCWPSSKIGLFTAARHATEGFAGLVLIAPLKTCFSEITIATFSALFNAGSYVLEAFANTDLMLYLVPIPATLAFLMIPMLKSVMSSMTSADKQGSLFSSIVTVQVVCSIISTYMFNTIYASTLSIFHGFVFLVLAGMSVLTVIILLFFAKTQTVRIAAQTVETIVTNS